MSEDNLEPDPVDWDLEERDRWLEENDQGETEDPTETLVDSDE